MDAIKWMAVLEIVSARRWPPPARGRSCRRPSAPGTSGARSASGGAREHVVEAPADVALPHVPPRRPPGEQPVVVRDRARGRRRRGPRPMIRSSSARSSGSWPIARGLRSFGCTSRSVRATFRSPQSTSSRARPRCSAAAYASIASRKPHLGGEVLAAVRHVDRGDGDRAGSSVGRR